MKLWTNPFVVCGLKQAGALLLFNLGLALLGMVCGETLGWPVSWPILLFSLSVGSGPVPGVLTLFDITNLQIYWLWGILVVPYWALLGTFAGLLLQAQAPRPGNSAATPVPTETARHTRRVIGIAALLLGLLGFHSVMSLFFIPSIGNNRNSFAVKVLLNLRAIENAKDQLALDKQLEPGASVVEADFAPFVTRFEPVGEERYVFGLIGDEPYAMLDSDWRIRRKGWRQGYTIPKGTTYRLPKRSSPASDNPPSVPQSTTSGATM